MARGPHDFVLKIVARNTAHENELTTRLTAAPHVATVQTIQVIRTAKRRPGVPIDPDGQIDARGLSGGPIRPVWRPRSPLRRT